MPRKKKEPDPIPFNVQTAALARLNELLGPIVGEGWRITGIWTVNEDGQPIRATVRMVYEDLKRHNYVL